MTAADWTPRQTEDGSWTLVHSGHREACHSRSGAWLEARERYAQACRLAERSDEAELRLLDVGCGLGWNLTAALEALAGGRARLHVASFESDEGVLRAALELFARAEVRRGPWGPWLDVVRRALELALEAPKARREEQGVALGERGVLRLILGDARTRIARVDGEAPWDAVFLDPFSPRTAPDLWEPAFLASVAARMGPGSWLSTYSATFPVRLALAKAGLRVGRGPRVGAKAEGTLASPDLDPPPLAPKVARRLSRALGIGSQDRRRGFCGFP